MLEDKLVDVNIAGELEVLTTPRELRKEIAIDDDSAQFVYDGRKEVNAILDGSDDRLLMVVGPCSIHDPEEALEYARLLQPLAEKVKDKMLVVMRTYFEKPRTRIGWKGLLYDPGMDDSADMEKGMRMSRQLLLDLAKMKVLTSTEFLSRNASQFYGDLISYASIGARTIESPDHRHFPSGLSMAVGMKNGTCGSIDKALDAVITARSPNTFIGPNMDGRECKIPTKGNAYAHMILRGGKDGSNYDQTSVDYALDILEKEGINTGLMIDASHGNSGKQPEKQPGIVKEVINLRNQGRNIAGVLVESYLLNGFQKLPFPYQGEPAIEKGTSKTDSCLGFEETEQMINQIYWVL
jgi:3-deoxy-7-phosphoheptulonate synthase